MTDKDDVVFGRVRDLVLAGEYLDELPGVPNTRGAPGQSSKPDELPERWRRIYWRGSPEHRAAKDRGEVEALPPLSPASPQTIADAEGVVGWPLPPLLRRMYLELGDGGFGPGYGLLPLSTPAPGHRRETIADLWQAAHRTPGHHPWSTFPEPLLPICHWGCGIYSFVDCSSSDAQMWAVDPNGMPRDVNVVFHQDKSLPDWLDRWVDGELYQTTSIEDERTMQWRGATDDEIKAMLPDDSEQA